MKKILILAITAFAVSCDSTEMATQTAETTQEPSIVGVEATTQATDSTDAASGATATANKTMLNGVIEIPPQNYATVSLPIDGIVRNIELIEGQMVSKGSVIAKLDNPQFIDLQQSLLDAQAQVEFLEAEYNRQKNLSQQDATSGRKLQQSKADYLSAASRLEATKAQLQLLGVAPEKVSQGIASQLSVVAPISGYVSNINANQGKHLMAGSAVCDIVNKSSILIKLTAYEKDLPKIKVGEQIEFRVNGIGKSYTARIVSIGQQVDLENRSVKVYAQSIDNSPMFRPGMYVTAKFN